MSRCGCAPKPAPGSTGSALIQRYLDCFDSLKVIAFEIKMSDTASMRATDLDLREMLEFDPKGGVIRFAGERAVLFNTVALGLLRRELVETLGLVTARG